MVACIGGSVVGQGIKFRKVLGGSGYDYGMSAKQTIDKGYILCGSTSTVGSGATDVYAIKTDSLGALKYEKSYGGINIDRGNCVRQTTDGGYIIAGYTNSIGNGGYDVYLIKTDSLLNMQWSKTYGGTDWDFGNCVEQTSDGGYIVCGATYSFGKGDEDYYIIKTNSTGDTMWTKTYGGIKEDVANSIIQTTDGGYIVTGTTKSMGDSLGDFYTVKMNVSGDTVWTNTFGGTQLDYGNDILQTQTGDYLVGGETQSFGAGDSDGMLVRISATGVTGSMINIGNTAFDNITSIAEALNGRIAMTGRTVSYGDAYGNGDIYFFVLTSSLGFFNSTTFGTFYKDIGYSVEPTEDNAFVICGYTDGFNNRLDDIYLIKTDTAGLSDINESVTLTGIDEDKEMQREGVVVYPNPAKNTTLLKWSNGTNDATIIEVVNMLGSVVYREVTEKRISNISVSVNGWDNGVYLVKVSDKNGIRTKKLIVQH